MWLHEFLIESRKAKGYSQNSFPKQALASSIQGWRDIETDKSAPQLGNLIRVGEKLGYTLVLLCNKASYFLRCKEKNDGRKRVWLEDQNVEAGDAELRLIIARLRPHEIVTARRLLKTILEAREDDGVVKKTKERKRA